MSTNTMFASGVGAGVTPVRSHGNQTEPRVTDHSRSSDVVGAAALSLVRQALAVPAVGAKGYDLDLLA